MQQTIAGVTTQSRPICPIGRINSSPTARDCATPIKVSVSAAHLKQIPVADRAKFLHEAAQANAEYAKFVKDAAAAKKAAEAKVKQDTLATTAARKLAEAKAKQDAKDAAAQAAAAKKEAAVQAAAAKKEAAAQAVALAAENALRAQEAEAAASLASSYRNMTIGVGVSVAIVLAVIAIRSMRQSPSVNVPNL